VENLVLVGPRPDGIRDESSEFSLEAPIDPLDLEHVQEPVA